MTIELLPYERRSLEALESAYQLDRELIVDFALSLSTLKSLFQKLILPHGHEAKEGRIVLMGLVNQTHNLLVGGLQSIETGNAFVWSACTRSLIEVFGACEKIAHQPSCGPRFLNEHGRIPAGKLRSAAHNTESSFKSDLERLDSTVHPGLGAIQAGMRVVDAEERTGAFYFGLRPFTLIEGRETMNVLAHLADLLREQLNRLAAREDVLSTGKVFCISTAIDLNLS